MAVTRTRTRTQTALTKVVELLAEANGEIQVLDQLLITEKDAVVRSCLTARRLQLQADQAAVCTTLEQFDPSLDVACVGASYNWLKQFGRGKPGLSRYRAALGGSVRT